MKKEIQGPIRPFDHTLTLNVLYSFNLSLTFAHALTKLIGRFKVQLRARLSVKAQKNRLTGPRFQFKLLECYLFLLELVT
jgi:hypothetical protein